MVTLDRPQFPALVLGPEGYVALEQREAGLSKCNLLALTRGFYKKTRVYDSAGFSWTVAEVLAPVRATRWLHMLASTIYNPPMHVTLCWAAPIPYELRSLQDSLCLAVDADDDVLTQNINSEDLKRVIQSSSSFSDLIKKLAESGCI